MQGRQNRAKAIARARGIGVFGGAFDPVHRGHVFAVLRVLEEFALSQIVVVPSFLSPHKEPKQIASFDDRMQMLQLAFGSEKKVALSDITKKRGGLTYAVDVIHDASEFFEVESLAYIVGSDAFANIRSWREPKKLLSLCDWIILARPGEGGNREEMILNKVAHNEFKWDQSENCYVHPAGRRFFFSHAPYLNISSVQIRNLLAGGNDISTLVPKAVLRFIQEKKLYQPQMKGKAIP